jgi:DNA-directed RNA polymerase subunit E"|tara:strand:+ start:823 stop:984 length:162 start_codon:yes stop_codon:yes gene_type:complete
MDDGIDQCRHHPSAKVTTDWQGYVIVWNPQRSEIASRLNIDEAGRYALKVNIR